MYLFESAQKPTIGEVKKCRKRPQYTKKAMSKRIIDVTENCVIKAQKLDIFSSVAVHRNVYSERNNSRLTQVHEKGHIFFFYRPLSTEVGYSADKDWWDQEQHVKSIADVARFYILLKPDRSMAPTAKNRLLTMTAKQMPRPKDEDMKGAIALRISDDIDDITHYLHGTRCWEGLNVPPARPCGEGLYEFVRHGFSGPVHFIYQLELPQNTGNVQHAFNIEKSASYTISMKNPDIILDPRHKPTLTTKQKEHFRGQQVEWLRWGNNF